MPYLIFAIFILGNQLHAQFNLNYGRDALKENSSGIHNSAFGNYALRSNTSGSFNTAFGASSLRANKTGSNNTTFGYQSLYRNISGKENTAIGSNALNTNQSGNYNTAIGTYSVAFCKACNHNTALGHRSLMSNVEGSGNIALGGYALQSNDAGSYNTAIGYYAMYTNTGGTNNTAIGNKSFTSGFDFSNSTAIGANTVVTASNQIRLGDTEIKSIGGQVDWTSLSDGRFKKIMDRKIPGLAFINQLRPVIYTIDNQKLKTYLRSGHTDKSSPIISSDVEDITQFSGLIAQEVEEIANAIDYPFSGIDAPKSESDIYGLRYASFTLPLIIAVQELSQKNTNLTERVTQLEDKLAQLEEKTKRLLAAIEAETLIK